MQLFALSAELACKEAMMTGEEKDRYYSEMPVFMHYFPQTYMFQKRLVQLTFLVIIIMIIIITSNMAAAEMQKGQAHIMQFLNSPEGRMKVESLGLRMTDIKKK